MQELYITVQDRFGARAKVFLSRDDIHQIVYEDVNGNKFFTEEYDDVPIEVIEQYALEWAKGERELA
jgi:predicted nuclease of restriction endonuclease-like RecB superfamily